MAAGHPYNESLLHWIWQHRYLRGDALHTAAGKAVRVVHPGYLNASDGPDFTNARIYINELRWHGDVEMHWQCGHWFSHGHQTDANYNRVVLHVVYDGTERPAERPDGSEVPTVFMKPALSHSLQYFFDAYVQGTQLPCAPHLPDVPHATIQKQFDTARDAYFEQKVDDLLEFYNPALPVSKAWKQLLTIGLFDGLGIRHNRAPMRALARQLLQHTNTASNELQSTALAMAELDNTTTDAPFNWKRKNSRPANHPKNRITQACALLAFIRRQPFRFWLRTPLDRAFETLLKAVTVSPGVGRQRGDVLKGTVWIPACYILGQLTGTRAKMDRARAAWNNHRLRLPGSITRPFNKAGVPEAIYGRRLATVHQQRAFCAPRSCNRCSIFKHIISS